MNPFRTAITFLALRGWYQNAPVDRNTGAVCIGYAAFLSSGRNTVGETGDLIRSILIKVVEEQFSDRIGDRNKSFPWVWFNDHKDTTVDDVILVLEKCAVEWDTQVV